MLNLPTSRLLWINTYLPTDPQTVNFDEVELIDVLGEIETLMDETDFQDIIWNGDLNSDMGRNSGIARIMSNFVAPNWLDVLVRTPTERTKYATLLCFSSKANYNELTDPEYLI